MKKLQVFILAGIIFFSTVFAANMTSPLMFTGGWKIWKSKKGILIAKEKRAPAASYCCTFSDGTKCYAEDRYLCGCSGIKLSDVEGANDAIQVNIDSRNKLSVKTVDATRKSSYCCTFRDGTICYSADCSFCNCEQNAETLVPNTRKH